MTNLTLFEAEPKKVRNTDRDLIAPSGRRLKTTAAFNSYWMFAAERQAMFYRRLRGDAILTHDKVLREHRFTNAYRAADRVSQFFINNVASGCEQNAKDIVFRTLIFKIFNRIETWTELEDALGQPIHWASFDFMAYKNALTRMMNNGQRIYSNAYMMPNPAFAQPNKHGNHLELIRSLIDSEFPARLETAPSLEAVYQLLLSTPSFGPFLAFQYAIDLNYTDLLDFDESAFVVAGPGALDGIKKCFADTDGYSAADIIRIMTEIAPEEFAKAGLDFLSLWGRPLHLIDCQNLFCEVDKYSRVMHPELVGASGRSRIKQRYSTSGGPLPAYRFPKRWKLNTSIVPPVSRLTYQD